MAIANTVTKKTITEGNWKATINKIDDKVKSIDFTFKEEHSEGTMSFYMRDHRSLKCLIKFLQEVDYSI